MKDYEKIYDLQKREFKEVETEYYGFGNIHLKPAIEEIVKEKFDLINKTISSHFSSNGHSFTFNIHYENDVYLPMTFNKQSGNIESHIYSNEITISDLDKIDVIEEKLKLYKFLTSKIKVETVKNIFSLYRKTKKEFEKAKDLFKKQTEDYNKALNSNKINKFNMIFQKVNEELATKRFNSLVLNGKSKFVLNIKVSKEDIKFDINEISLRERSDGKKIYYSGAYQISKKVAKEMFLNDFYYKNNRIEDLSVLPFYNKENNYYNHPRYLNIKIIDMIKKLEPDIVKQIVNDF